MAVDITSKSPSKIRKLIRKSEWDAPTSGLAPGYIQANLVILPQAQAFDFLLFCQRNPKSCPLIEVMEPGATEPILTAPKADIRYDLPRYRVYIGGSFAKEVDEIWADWREDLVTFLLGCSFTFESALISEGLPVRHLENGKNVPMYITDVPTVPAGQFSGPLVVSMRPIPYDRVVEAIEITSRFPRAHGSPVQVGDPEAIGIKDLYKPDYGDPPDICDGEVPVFWACGVTPQAVATHSNPPIMITHAPGYMFITDLRDEELSVL